MKSEIQSKPIMSIKVPQTPQDEPPQFVVSETYQNKGSDKVDKKDTLLYIFKKMA